MVEILVRIAPGKKLLIQYLDMLEPDADGNRKVFFRLNGQTRTVMVKDESVAVEKAAHLKATEPNQVGSPLQGRLTKVMVKEGQAVKKNQPLFVIEAMKMESTISANQEGKVQRVYLQEGIMVEQDDMVVELTQS